MTQPTYRRHPMDKRRPAPHLAPRSPKRMRHEQRFERFLRRWLDGLAAAADAARASADALIPDTRQETRP